MVDVRGEIRDLVVLWGGGALVQGVDCRPHQLLERRVPDAHHVPDPKVRTLCEVVPLPVRGAPPRSAKIYNICNFKALQRV